MAIGETWHTERNDVQKIYPQQSKCVNAGRAPAAMPRVEPDVLEAQIRRIAYL